MFHHSFIDCYGSGGRLVSHYLSISFEGCANRLSRTHQVVASSSHSKIEDEDANDGESVELSG